MRQCFGVGIHRGLGGRVDPKPCEAGEAGNGRRGQDVASAPLSHEGQDGARHAQLAEEVRFEHVLRFGVVRLLDRADQSPACVVDKHIDATVQGRAAAATPAATLAGFVTSMRTAMARPGLSFSK